MKATSSTQDGRDSSHCQAGRSIERGIEANTSLQSAVGGSTQEKGAKLNWHTFEEVAPEMAAVWKELFERTGGVMLIGTIRRDGSPRISNVDPCILAGELYLGMMWH